MGDAEAQEGVSPSSRAGKAARLTSSGMSSRVLVSAARRASFSLSIICSEQRGREGTWLANALGSATLGRSLLCTCSCTTSTISLPPNLLSFLGKQMPKKCATDSKNQRFSSRQQVVTERALAWGHIANQGTPIPSSKDSHFIPQPPVSKLLDRVLRLVYATGSPRSASLTLGPRQLVERLDAPRFVRDSDEQSNRTAAMPRWAPRACSLIHSWTGRAVSVVARSLGSGARVDPRSHIYQL